MRKSNILSPYVKTNDNIAVLHSSLKELLRPLIGSLSLCVVVTIALLAGTQISAPIIYIVIFAWSLTFVLSGVLINSISTELIMDKQKAIISIRNRFTGKTKATMQASDAIPLSTTVKGGTGINGRAVPDRYHFFLKKSKTRETIFEISPLNGQTSDESDALVSFYMNFWLPADAREELNAKIGEVGRQQ